MKPLIPHFIQEQFQKGQNSGEFEAFALFLDLSGFTAMTETLMQRGNQGAEILSNILNDIFNPLVEIVYAEGGFIPYFAGDAFHAVFPYGKNEKDGIEILAIANRFIHRFGGNQFSDEFVIKCKIGVTYGTVDWGIVGGEHKNFYFRGSAIERSADCQTKAKAQQIIFDNFLLEKTNQKVAFSTFQDVFHIFENKNVENYLISTNSVLLPEIEEAVGLSFLPKSVIEFNQSGEFRDIVSVFISFEGVKDHDSLNDFATIVLEQIHSFSGYFKEIDFGDKGGVMLAFFGAPLSYENNSERALEFAQNIIAEAKNLPDVSVRIGISAGTAYTGIIGGQERAQYAAVGSRVNLAARLMASAEKGTVFTDQEIIRNKNFRFTYEGNIHFKGIAKDVATYRLVGRKGDEELSFAGMMVGRQTELDELIQFGTPILSNQFAGVVTLFGEAGIGKSRMAFELKKSLLAKGVKDFIICQADQTLKKPFNPFIYALKNYFEQSIDKSNQDNKANFERNFEALLSECLESNHVKADGIIRELIRTKSILSSLVGLLEDDSLWSQLEAKGRYENTLAAIQNFFLAEAMLHPLMIEIEDGHWLDNDSLGLLPDLVQKLRNFSVFILITSRYNDDGSKPIFLQLGASQNTIPYLEIDLNILKIEALQSMAELRLGGQIDTAFLEFLHRSCNGNPFYAEQMLEYFSETALLEKTEQNAWTVKDKTMKLSSSINAVLMARVDRLSYLVKETVKAAAVIGREFEIPVLSEVMKQQDDFAKKNGNQHILLKEQIQTAERSQIWWAMNELRYIFKHSLLREAIYDMQLRARLRELHRMIAEAIEKVYNDNIEERFADLAFHYEQANETTQTIDYLEKAASFAKRNYQNRQALEYYEKLFHYYEEENNSEELIKLLLKKGEVEQLLGVWNDAETSFTTALLRASVFNDEMLSARAHNALGSLLMLKGQYASAKDYFEQGLVVFEKNEDAIGLSKSYGNLANLNFRQGNYLVAEQNFLQCLDTIRAVDEKLINPQIIANLGLTYMNLNNYKEGIRQIQSFLPIAEANNDRLGLASLHTNLGIILFEKGDYDEALKNYKEGLAISEELGNKLLISIAVGCIGSVYERKGNFEKALSHFEEDLKLTQALGDKQGIAIAFGLLGGHFTLKGEFEKALSFLEPNLKLCEELGYQKGVIKALNSLGDVSYFQGDAQKSAVYYKKSVEVALKINNSLLYGLGLVETGFVYLHLNKIEETTDILSKIEELIQKVPNKEFHFEYTILSAAYHRKKGNTAKAEAILQKAMQLTNLSEEEELAIYFEFALLFPQTTTWKPRVIKGYQVLYAKTPKFLYLHKIQLLGKI